MAELTLYYHKRADGGYRTGVEYEGDLLGERFVEGPSDPEPALLWYVEIRCSGEDLPNDFEGAKAWLLRHRSIIGQLLTETASELRAGLDPDIYPVERSISEGSVEFKLLTSAMRRFDAVRIGVFLHTFAGEWESLLNSCSALVPA